MSPAANNVSLSIGGRDYSVSCDPGEEKHLAHLGQMIDARLKTIPSGSGHSESRALLFAALLLADEVCDLQNAAAAPPAASLLAAGGDAIVPPDRLAMIADRLEALVDAIGVPSWSEPGAQA